MQRVLVKALVAVAALLMLACLVLYASLRRSLPLVDGTARVAGLSAPIDIIRDADAVPHIFASTRLDAVYGLGYVHAQDRLWQMEFQRRTGLGRLSEIFGAATLSQDRFLRTVGFARAARTAWATMPEDARQQVNAYVAGVNAFLAEHHGSALPPEFRILGFEPEPWTPVDVVVWVKMMAWDLSANYTLELLRQDIAQAVGREKLAQLMPPYAVDGLSILTARASAPITKSATTTEGTGLRDTRDADVRSISANGSWTTAFARSLSNGDPAVADLLLGGPATESLGSNNWVVDGTLSATGRPLLANDPHLSAKVPSIWYLAHLSAGDFDVIGATLPGGPAVVLGRNRFIAWGTTNAGADVEDLYRETLDATGRSALFRGVQEPLQIISETIAVKGGAPVRVDVRVSRHGPLVSDAINATSANVPAANRRAPLEPLALRWTALDATDTTTAAILRVDAAHNWNEFVTALASFVVPSQNFVYADVNGHIGFYAPGRIPIRAHGDGSQPADGSSGEAEWTGWVPFAELPHVYDPPEHFIVTANQRPAPASYPYMLGVDWQEPYRAQRITDLLRRKAALTPDDFAAMQADTLSLHAQALVPLLIARAHPASAPDAQALAIVRQWNHDARADSAAAAIFEAWFLRLVPAIAGDDLGPRLTAGYAGRFSFVTRFIVNTLTANDAAWCDDRRTPARETCDDAVSAALHEGVAGLTRQLGSDMARWRWDAVHRAVFPHQGLDAVAALRPLFSRSVASAGDWSTIDVGAVAVDRPFEQRSVASYREIIDLSTRNDSRFLDAVGESGHPLSPHYDDFLPDWRAVRYRPMRMERADIERGAIGHLRLETK
jgi:penicillin G amidase